jgi:hypothetical protein
MLEKLICFLQGKVAPLGLLLTLIVSIILTAVEVRHYGLGDQEEIILFFMFTFLFSIFIFLLLAKIYELSQEKVEPTQLAEKEEND